MTEDEFSPSRRFWRRCRTYFRRFRIAVWFCVLLFLGLLIYLNQVGLPAAIKRPLLQKLKARGIDLQFSRLRLRWYEGIVAENVRFGRADDPGQGELRINEVQLLFNLRALAHARLQVDQLVLRHGRLVLPAFAADGEPRRITVTNIQTHLRLLPDDQWALDHFRADLAGAQIRLSGLVTNASAVADWQFFHGQRTEPASSEPWQRRLARLSERLDHIHFSAPPELTLDVRGDARDLQSFTVRLAIEAPGAETPWGTLANGKFSGRLLPADPNEKSRAEILINASSAQTRWASVTNLQLRLVLTSSERATNLISGELELMAGAVQTEWAQATNARFSAAWLHSMTNPVPLSGHGRFDSDLAETKWAGAAHVELSGSLSKPPPGELPGCDGSWAWWTNLQPYALEWECRISQPHSPDVAGQLLAVAGRWRAPKLSLTNVVLVLDNGRISAQADLDVLSRRVQAVVDSNLDPHNLRSLLPEAANRWLDQFSWSSQPRLSGQVEVTLPSWTNAHPDWRGEVQPSLSLAGEFSLAQASFRQAAFETAHSHFSYSNLCWHLPDLSLSSLEGRIEAEHKANDATKDFYWRVHSSVDLHRFVSLLAPEAQKGFALIQFTNPPVVDFRLWGRAHEPERTGVCGSVYLTNFSFRGQAAEWLRTDVDYTNRVLRCLNTRVGRGDEEASLQGLTADFNSEFVFLTNGVSTFDPMAIAIAIGPKIGQTIQPYHFEKPPHARVYGAVPMHGEEGADLHFDLEGGPFAWWRFHVPQIAGHVHWAGLQLFLKDVRLNLYGGDASGSAQFDFLPAPQGTEFQFKLATRDALLQGLMADLSTQTNHLEGWLSGSVTVTKANTKSWSTVNGTGDLELKDGVIWDIPLFGIFSPVLNGISPGLGNFRAGAGSCTFTITNGIIHSEDLQIRSPTVRLQYRGTLDFDSRVQARVEAELLRDVWLVGPIVSTVLWPVTKMFEYKVSGSLSDPKLEPVYLVPKLVLMPFHPIRTLKSLFPQDQGGRTNAGPPVFENLPQK